MSRLDSFIRRLEAQRACLGLAVGLVRQIEGAFLEMGLGNGRTFDHLREIAPEREIIVFERQVAAHPDCVPHDDQLVLGDIFETLPRHAERLRLWQQSFSEETELEKGLDLNQIARKYELSGGSIMNIVRYASLQALESGGSLVTLETIQHGIRREYAKEG